MDTHQFFYRNVFNSFYLYNSINSLFLQSNLRNFFFSHTYISYTLPEINSSRIPPILSIYNSKHVNYETTNWLERVLYSKRASLINFFIENNIDVPICFQKSTSLKRLNRSLPFLKMISYISKHGKKEKYLKIFFSSINFFFKQFGFEFSTTPYSPSWRPTFWLPIFTFLTFSLEYQTRFLNISFNPTPTEQAHLEHSMTKKEVQEFRSKYLSILSIFSDAHRNDGKYINTTTSLKNILIQNILTTQPLFHFYTFNVDKNIRKFSRGKSGKYLFVWKFIPTHKRNLVTLKLITKNIKFSNGRTLKLKISNLFRDVCLSPSSSFLWKTKIFSYNYVFKNYKRTLMYELKTKR